MNHTRKVIVARLILVGLVSLGTLLALWIYRANRVGGKDGKDSLKIHHHKHTFKRHQTWRFRRRRHH